MDKGYCYNVIQIIKEANIGVKEVGRNFVILRNFRGT